MPNTPDPQRPCVLFVCVKNGGKSQMAAALTRDYAGDSVEVHSCGIRPGTALNDLSRQVIDEVGASMTGQSPRGVDPEVLRRADRVIVLGSEAHLEPLPDMRTTITTWETDEPSMRGIDGIERMRLVRDDIARRVRELLHQLSLIDRSDRPW